jgi:hypothetical protein
MKYLLFLLWIPAAILLYLSIRQEVAAEKGRDVEKKPAIIVHAEHPHRARHGNTSAAP